MTTGCTAGAFVMMRGGVAGWGVVWRGTWRVAVAAAGELAAGAHLTPCPTPQVTDGGGMD